MSSKEQIMQAAYGPTGYVAPREKQTASPKQKVVMSRDLLKRAVTLIKCLNGASWEHEIPQVVIQDIETYLAQPKPEPVAWLSDRGTIWHDKTDAIDDSDGFIEPLYTTQSEPEPVAWVGTGLLPVSSEEIMRMKTYEPGTAALYDTPLYTTQPDQSARIAELIQHLKDAHAENAEFCQIIERQTKQLAALQAKRECLNDDEIRDCAESENLPYFENKEEFDAFARAIEQAVLKANGFMGE